IRLHHTSRRQNHKPCAETTELKRQLEDCWQYQGSREHHLEGPLTQCEAAQSRRHCRERCHSVAASSTGTGYSGSCRHRDQPSKLLRWAVVNCSLSVALPVERPEDNKAKSPASRGFPRH